MKRRDVAARMDQAISNLVERGYLDFHPDDGDKPWRLRRLRRTAKGVARTAELQRRERLRVMGMELPRAES